MMNSNIFKNPLVPFIVLAISGSVACGLAGAQTPATPSSPAHSKLMSVLSAEEYVPSADDLARLGPGIADQLISIASDSQADPAYRARALALLQLLQRQCNPTRSLQTSTGGYLNRGYLRLIDK